MLTQLSTVKARLVITVADYDDLLTAAIKAISTRFDKETNRTFARTTGLTDEFFATDTEVPVSCFPIESVTKWEAKTNETDGWVEQTSVQYLIRRSCVISLRNPSSSILNPASPALARVTYTGGYVLPGETPAAGQTVLPDDLQQAAVEQVAYWFRNREKPGLLRSGPTAGIFDTFLQSDLLLEVRAVLKRYERFSL
jgi:hypothetical protein